LIAFLDKVFATKPQREWHRILIDHDVFCTPVNTFLGLKDDPQAIQNEYIIDFNHPVFGKGMIPGYPVRFSETPADTRGLAPGLGQHTEEVLRDIGGYSESDMAHFKQVEVI
jgi:crotonobetainyl-CoA:carnitine CoA-transferase CaiB-like acyl-CoA transferase